MGFVRFDRFISPTCNSRGIPVFTAAARAGGPLLRETSGALDIFSPSRAGK
jgi:hypothetical protein